MARPVSYSREEVLEKALLLFHQQGYESTGMQQLVECMGISRHGIYTSFGDKEGLFKAALQLYREKTVKRMIQSLNETETPLTTIRSVFLDTLNDHCSRADQKGCFIANTMAEPCKDHEGIANILAENRLEVIAALELAIQKAQQLNEIAKGINPSVTAQLLYSLNSGLALTSRIDNNRDQLIAALELGLSVLDR